MNFKHLSRSFSLNTFSTSETNILIIRFGKPSVVKEGNRTCPTFSLSIIVNNSPIVCHITILHQKFKILTWKIIDISNKNRNAKITKIVTLFWNYTSRNVHQSSLVKTTLYYTPKNISVWYVPCSVCYAWPWFCILRKIVIGITS